MRMNKAVVSAAVALSCLIGTAAAKAEVDPKSIALTLPKDIKWTGDKVKSAVLYGDPKKPGTSWDWTFVMAGAEFSGRAETVGYEAGKKFSYRTTTGVESTFTYTAEPQGGGVKVTVDVTYDVPGTLLSRMQASVVEKLNDAEGVRAVENLKAILDQ